MRVIPLLLLAVVSVSCVRVKATRSSADAAPATRVAASADAETRVAQAAVLEVVNRLWEAMRTNDSVMARSVFDSTAQFASIVDRDGARFVRWSRADRFVSAIGNAKEPWIERMVAPEVRVDGNLASVWTWYDFSVGGKVSHCGYDSIELANTSAGWKIIYIADTRHMTGCDRPPASK